MAGAPVLGLDHRFPDRADQERADHVADVSGREHRDRGEPRGGALLPGPSRFRVGAIDVGRGASRGVVAPSPLQPQQKAGLEARPRRPGELDGAGRVAQHLNGLEAGHVVEEPGA
jgi:hypothetical protein